MLPEKIRVVELASVLAGPSVGMFFAELGAEVIKVENPAGGDVTRSWKLLGESADEQRPAYFCAVNWGKKSICLNLNTSAGKEQLFRLLATTDVALTSFKPGDAQKFGLNWEVLHRRFPRLILGEISGYGANNPRVGYDATIQAEAGFTGINGLPGQLFKMPVALVDVLAAHQLKAGVLLALWQRSTDGLGRQVQVSLMQAAIAALVNQGANYLVGGQVPQPIGNAHPNIVPYGQPFVCADGKSLVLAVGTDKQFERLCQLLQIDDMAASENYQTNAARVKNRVAVNTRLAEAFLSRNSDELIQALENQHIPFGRMNTLAEVAQLPAARAMLMQVDQINGWRSAVFMPEPAALSAPPLLGEHQNLLAQLMAHN